MNDTTRNLRNVRFASWLGAAALLLASCADDASLPTTRRDAGSVADPADASMRADAGEVDASDAASPASEQPDIAAFRAALEAQRYDELPELIANLERAVDDRPSDADVVLALALANLWAVAEAGRVEPDPARDGMHALAAQSHFLRAQELAPDDARIDGWLGSLRVRIGVTLASDSLVQRGFDDLARGVARNPEFNLFVQAFQLASTAPAGDAQLVQAADAFIEAAVLCELGVSRDSPALASVGGEPAADASPVCSNGPKVPHNLEGFWLFGGDVLLKSGDRTTAVAFYDNARREGLARGWSFVELAEQRIEDATAWAADLDDDDATNDPVLSWDRADQCVLCHAR